MVSKAHGANYTVSFVQMLCVEDVADFEKMKTLTLSSTKRCDWLADTKENDNVTKGWDCLAYRDKDRLDPWLHLDSMRKVTVQRYTSGRLYSEPLGLNNNT